MNITDIETIVIILICIGALVLWVINLVILIKERRERKRSRPD
jgi:hypothetical protein